jgi:hypothetical protein
MTQAFNLSQLANYVNTSGQLNGASGITGTVPSATTAGSISNASGWNIIPSGTTLFFNYNGTNVGKLTSTGVFTTLSDIVANGTI